MKNCLFRTDISILLICVDGRPQKGRFSIQLYFFRLLSQNFRLSEPFFFICKLVLPVWSHFNLVVLEVGFFIANIQLKMTVREFDSKIKLTTFFFRNDNVSIHTNIIISKVALSICFCVTFTAKMLSLISVTDKFLYKDKDGLQSGAFC